MQCRLPPFDDLVELARNRPDELEKLRIALCENAIRGAPVALRPQLRGLQFRIDMESRRYSTPMARCLRISTMMHESLAELARAFTNVPENLGQQCDPVAGPQQQSVVIPFPKR